MKPEQIGMTEEVERRAGPRIDLQQIETLRPHKEVRAVQTDEPRLWNYARDRVRHLSRPSGRQRGRPHRAAIPERMGGCRVGPLFAEAENKGAVSVGEEQCGDRPSFGALLQIPAAPLGENRLSCLNVNAARSATPLPEPASLARLFPRDLGMWDAERAAERSEVGRSLHTRDRAPACCPAACARAPSRRPEFGRSSKPLAYAMPSTARPSASRSSACNSEAPRNPRERLPRTWMLFAAIARVSRSPNKSATSGA